MVTRRAFLTGRRDGGREAAAPTVVCVFLRGGADTMNMVVPYGDDRYYAARPTIAIPPPGSSSDAAIRLDDLYGLHPRMAPLLGAFREGRLGILQAVGSDDTTGSHFEAQDRIEHGEGASRRLGGGWIGRFLRAKPAGASPVAAVAIGTVVPESFRGAARSSVLASVDDLRLAAPNGSSGDVTRALGALYGADAGDLRGPGAVALDLLARVEALRAEPYVPAGGAAYGADPFSSGLREVARLAKADVGLEVACVDLDGWDTHFLQGGAEGLQADAIGTLATGLAAFDADLATHRERVVTIVMTEFGRRIYENGSAGTDHGRGFALMALGAGVNGGRVHGPWPGLDVDEGPIGPGGLRVEIDYRSALADLLTRVGGLADIRAVFPDFTPQPTGLF
jgi:uncharacterized protein (DUF1501 family)